MVDDRTWMINKGASDRAQLKYIEGVESFLEFAFKDKEENAVLRCPCMSCLHAFFLDQDTMWTHLMENGIMNDYDPWEFHGEDPIQSAENELGSDGDDLDVDDDMMRDDMAPLINEALNVRFPGVLESAEEIDDVPENLEMPQNFERLMRSAEEDLYPGCKTFLKLEFMITLLHIKVSHKWSDKSFSMLLNALHRAFGFDETFPKSSYEAKKLTKDLGLNYVKIDACINHCVLYRKEYANCDFCPTCGCSRWEETTNVQDDSGSGVEGLEKRVRVPRLVLRHFPLIPRLQRFYMSSKLTEHMQWHKQSRTEDGLLRHPADSKAWKFIDECFPNFSSESRNVRHKDKSMDKFVEDKLEEFKQLHEEQLKDNGVDNLTVEEAYMRVLGTSAGYINGLGYGPKPPKAKSGRVTYEESIQLKEQIQVLQQDKIIMLEKINKMKQDAMEREEKMKQDSKEREERMREEFRVMMQEQLRAFTSGQMNLHK